MGTGPHHPAFGRRAGAATNPASARGRTAEPLPPAPQAAPPPPADAIRWTDHADPELDDWKRARRWQLPWRQISLLASLCFGIASLVLPDTVNDKVQWLLYGLAAASLYAGWRKKRA